MACVRLSVCSSLLLFQLIFIYRIAWIRFIQICEVNAFGWTECSAAVSIKKKGKERGKWNLYDYNNLYRISVILLFSYLNVCVALQFWDMTENGRVLCGFFLWLPTTTHYYSRTLCTESIFLQVLSLHCFFSPAEYKLGQRPSGLQLELFHRTPLWLWNKRYTTHTAGVTRSAESEQHQSGSLGVPGVSAEELLDGNGCK